MSDEYCKQDVWRGWHHGRCNRKAKRDGFCTQHHPDSVAKRRLKADERAKEKDKNSVYTKLRVQYELNRKLQAKVDELEAKAKASCNIFGHYWEPYGSGLRCSCRFCSKERTLKGDSDE